MVLVNDFWLCEIANIQMATDIEFQLTIIYIHSVTQSKVIRDDWTGLFSAAALALRDRQYDLEGFSISKVENGLTGLLQAELIGQNPHLNFYTEVSQSRILEETHKRESLNETKNEEASAEEDVKGAFDLVCLGAKSLQWRRPKIYVEFKFLYTTDIYTSGAGSKAKIDGELVNDKDLLQFLKDLSRLQKVKFINPETTCLQGFYICQNSNHDYLRNGTKTKKASVCHHEARGLCNECVKARYEAFLNFYADSQKLKKVTSRIAADKTRKKMEWEEKLKESKAVLNSERRKKIRKDLKRIESELEILCDESLTSGLGDWQCFKLGENSSDSTPFWINLAMLEIAGKATNRDGLN